MKNGFGAASRNRGLTAHFGAAPSRVYRKALYREYTDASFASLKARPAGSEYLGALGPVLRAEVGETIRIVFKNNASRPYSMHPHGVFYNKDSEGAAYADGSFPSGTPGVILSC